MNDFDLERKLKSVPLPERTEEYWENFPSQMRSQLRPAAARMRPRNVLLPRLAWAGGVAFACLVLSLSLWPALHGFLKNEKTFRRELAQLPGHLRVLMADEHGMHYLVADKE